MAQLLTRGQSSGQGISDFEIIIMDTIIFLLCTCGNLGWKGEKESKELVALEIHL